MTEQKSMNANEMLIWKLTDKLLSKQPFMAQDVANVLMDAFQAGAASREKEIERYQAEINALRDLVEKIDTQRQKAETQFKVLKTEPSNTDWENLRPDGTKYR